MIAVIVGSAGCALEDYRKLELLLVGKDVQVFAVNFACMLPIHFSYVVSLHKEYINMYKSVGLVRANEYRYRENIYTVAPANATYNFDSSVNGTSGRYAVDFARSIGAEKIILCGIPMDGSNRFYGDIIHDYTKRIDVAEWKNQDKTNLRSMSGNTKLLFGEPTLEWINKGEDK